MSKKYVVSRCDTSEDGEYCEEDQLEEFDTLEEAERFMESCYESSYPVIDIWAAELYLYEDGKNIRPLLLN